MALVVETYARCAGLPKDERYELSSQLRRAAVSVVANIAEGHGRTQRRDFAQFLGIARGSLAELETHLDIAEALGYLKAADLATARGLADEVGRMLSALQRKLVQRRKREPEARP